MERNLVRPTYKKAEPDDFFKKMQKEVQDTVLKDPSIQRTNIIKSIGLLLSYFGIYSMILLVGNNTGLLFLLYILLGFNTIILFINAFHDAAHGAVSKRRNITDGYVRIGIVRKQ